MSDAVNHPIHYGGEDDPYEAINTVVASTEKKCSQCEQNCSLDQFPPDNRRKDRRASKCRDCVRINTEAYYARYPKAESQRRMRNAEHGKAWHQRNRSKQIARMRWNRAKKVYGINKEDYENLLVAQGGRCAICRADSPGRDDQFFAIDHDHATGVVRGLLCQRCNSGLGFFLDNPELMREAATYVERSRQPATLQVAEAGTD